MGSVLSKSTYKGEKNSGEKDHSLVGSSRNSLKVVGVKEGYCLEVSEWNHHKEAKKKHTHKDAKR